MAAYGAGTYGDGPYGGVTLLEAVTRTPQRAPSIRRGGPAADTSGGQPASTQAQAAVAAGTGYAAVNNTGP